MGSLGDLFLGFLGRLANWVPWELVPWVPWETCSSCSLGDLLLGEFCSFVSLVDLLLGFLGRLVPWVPWESCSGGSLGLFCKMGARGFTNYSARTAKFIRAEVDGVDNRNIFCIITYFTKTGIRQKRRQEKNMIARRLENKSKQSYAQGEKRRALRSYLAKMCGSVSVSSRWL